MHLLRNRFHPFPIPTARHYTRMQNPIGWPVPASRQFAHLSLFFIILRYPRSQNLGHLLAPLFLPEHPLFYSIIF